MKPKLAAALCLALIPSTAEPSDEARAFESLLRQAAPGAEEEFPLSRCAALYRSLLVSVDPDLLSADAVDSLVLAEGTFGASAAGIRVRTRGEDQKTAVDAVAVQTLALAQVYIERYAANRLKRDHSWADDPVLAADWDMCMKMLDPPG